MLYSHSPKALIVTKCISLSAVCKGKIWSEICHCIYVCSLSKVKMPAYWLVSPTRKFIMFLPPFSLFLASPVPSYRILTSRYQFYILEFDARNVYLTTVFYIRIVQRVASHVAWCGPGRGQNWQRIIVYLFGLQGRNIDRLFFRKKLLFSYE